ncbi:MAG: extracellular solute-binding protein [Chloroflexi bacterium]|nr:extracellular solute-binding protein [Chloroflexota bacterium]
MISRFMQRKFVGLIALLAIALVAAGCGADATATPTATSPAQATATPTGPTDDAYINDLYQKALAEGGELNIMMDSSIYDDLFNGAFADLFPGIQVNIEVASTPERPTKVIAQYQGNNVTTDMVNSSAGVAASLIDRGYLLGADEVDWTALGYEGDYLQGNGHNPIFYDFVYAHTYNTDEFSASDFPTDLSGFLDPKWKGKLAVDNFLYFFGMGFVGMSEGEEGAKLLTKQLLDDAEATLSSSYRDLVNAKEKPVALFSSVDRTLVEQRKGNNVDYFFTGTHGVARISLPILTDAPHPNTAQLMLWWLASPEGQQGIFDTAAVARTGPSQNNPVQTAIDASGTNVVYESSENFQERARIANAVRSFALGQ